MQLGMQGEGVCVCVWGGGGVVGVVGGGGSSTSQTVSFLQHLLAGRGLRDDIHNVKVSARGARRL